MLGYTASHKQNKVYLMRIFLWAALAVAMSACARSTDTASLAVEPQRLQAHIEFLASDNLRGRDTATREYAIAAEYVAAQFRQQGLLPAGDGESYFQQVPLVEHRLVEGSARAVVETPDGEVELAYPEQFIMGPDRKVANQSVTADTVFVGYGIVAPDYLEPGKGKTRGGTRGGRADRAAHAKGREELPLGGQLPVSRHTGDELGGRRRYARQLLP